MSVPPFEIFVFECLLIRIDALTTRPIALSDVTALDNQAIYNAMNFAAQVMQLAGLIVHLASQLLVVLLLLPGILARAETAEVLGRNRRDVHVELKNDTTSIL